MGPFWRQLNSAGLAFTSACGTGAAAILLLFTGLIIHRPDTFGIFSSEWCGCTTSGLLLVVNATLSLFYHVASGQIQQFIPDRAASSAGRSCRSSTTCAVFHRNPTVREDARPQKPRCSN
jgi:hypothetical protein